MNWKRKQNKIKTDTETWKNWKRKIKKLKIWKIEKQQLKIFSTDKPRNWNWKIEKLTVDTEILKKIIEKAKNKTNNLKVKTKNLHWHKIIYLYFMEWLKAKIISIRPKLDGNFSWSRIPHLKSGEGRRASIIDYSIKK